MSISGFEEKYFFYGFFPQKKKNLLKDLNILSKINCSIVFFISPSKINKIIEEIKVFFKGVSEQERFNLIDRGITFHAKAGNAPVVLNVSSDQVSNKKLIKISNSFLKD